MRGKLTICIVIRSAGLLRCLLSLLSLLLSSQQCLHAMAFSCHTPFLFSSNNNNTSRQRSLKLTSVADSQREPRDLSTLRTSSRICATSWTPMIRNSALSSVSKISQNEENSDDYDKSGPSFQSMNAENCNDHHDLSKMQQLNPVQDAQRRRLLGTMFSTMALGNGYFLHPSQCNALDNGSTITTDFGGIHDPKLRNYYNPSLPDWRGTSLPGPLSLSEMYDRLIMIVSQQSTLFDSMNPQSTTTATPTMPMARWPDPILRRSSSPIPLTVFQNEQQLQQLQYVARALRNTAREEGAVGLAAQQCGVDISLIFIDGVVGRNNGNSRKAKLGRITGGKGVEGVVGGKSFIGEGSRDKRSSSKSYHSAQNEEDEGIFLVNPRIINRSPESEMLVWTEECLVLPPQFRATLLRDAEITIEYESLESLDSLDTTPTSSPSCGVTKQITLTGESARCAAHEMDHDRGVLIVDHVSLEELLSVGDDNFMARIENSDALHGERMERAYSRGVYESRLISNSNSNSLVRHGDNDDTGRPWFVESANAMEGEELNFYQDTANASSLSSSPSTSSSTTPQSSSPNNECDEACIAERKERIAQRRAMMKQSRSNTNRGDVLELSRQRALLYGTEFGGLPPSYCSGSNGGFCP